MTGHLEQITVPYAASDMFSLVADIESYPQFIKWVKALRKSRPRDEGDVHHCLGEAVIGFKGFTERFATTVEADRSALSVKARLVRGPFRRLENDWHFVTTDDGQTRIEFRIDYQFSNPVLSALAVANRDRAVDKIMEAFLQEAAKRFQRVEKQTASEKSVVEASATVDTAPAPNAAPETGDSEQSSVALTEKPHGSSTEDVSNG